MGMLHYIRPGSKRRILAGDTPNWIKNSKRASYILRVVLSAPFWVRFSDFKVLRARAEWETAMTGKLNVLDHIVPISHPRVCGLTVPWNVRVVPWDTNCSKGNAWCEDQMRLDLKPRRRQTAPSSRSSTTAVCSLGLFD